jgi:hypothetical protein
LTFLSGTNLGTTLPVRITRIRVGRFRGRLAARPAQSKARSAVRWRGARAAVLHAVLKASATRLETSKAPHQDRITPDPPLLRCKRWR